MRFRNGRSVGSRAWRCRKIAFHVAAVAEEVFVVLAIAGSGHYPGRDVSPRKHRAVRHGGIQVRALSICIGIDEAGSGAVAGVLGLPPVTGVTLALVRRIRIIMLECNRSALLVRRRR